MRVGKRSRFHYFPGDRYGPHGINRYHWPESMYKRWLWMSDTPITVILEEGEQTVSIGVREDGAAIDQVALVPVDAPAPEGILKPNVLPAAEPANSKERYVARLGLNHGVPARGMMVSPYRALFRCA